MENTAISKNTLSHIYYLEQLVTHSNIILGEASDFVQKVFAIQPVLERIRRALLIMTSAVKAIDYQDESLPPDKW